MGILDKITGRDGDKESRYPASEHPTRQSSTVVPTGRNHPPQDTEELALERYRHLLTNAGPDILIRAHIDALDGMPVEKRAIVRESLIVAGTRPEDDSPGSLANALVQAEEKQPGTIEKALGSSASGNDSADIDVRGEMAKAVVSSKIVSEHLADFEGGGQKAVEDGVDQSAGLTIPFTDDGSRETAATGEKKDGHNKRDLPDE
jgi:hypothetical protein